MKIKYIFSTLVGILLSATSVWGQWTEPVNPIVEVSTFDKVEYKSCFNISTKHL